MPQLRLRALGLCGADDSIDPHLLGVICHSYPFVEFGVLFRPDQEGQPRYATQEWVRRMGQVSNLRLAAHLCGSRVHEVLAGDDRFLSTLPALGFGRVQINATRVNGVTTSNLAATVPALVGLMNKWADRLEFILQQNEETRPLWEGLSKHYADADDDDDRLPSHITMLVDESKGTGTLAEKWPAPPNTHEIGYAGGIGPTNIGRVLRDVSAVALERPVWIDMESSLRSTLNGKDIFDLNKCYQCITAVCDKENNIDLHHPEYLVGTSIALDATTDETTPPNKRSKT